MRLPSDCGAVWKGGLLWAVAAAALLTAASESIAAPVDRDTLRNENSWRRLDELRCIPIAPALGSDFSKRAIQTGWSELFAGPDAREPTASFVVHEGSLVRADNFFESSGGRRTMHVAQWDGSRWRAMAGGFTQLALSSLFTFDGNLYVAGIIGIGQVHDIRRYHLLRWNGEDWADAGAPFSDNIAATAEVGRFLFAADIHSDRGDPGIYTKGIRRFGGSGWAEFGPQTSNVPGTTLSLLAYDGVSRLAVAGRFTAYGDSVVHNVAEITLDGARYMGHRGLGAGLDGQLAAMVYFEGDLVVGGHFTRQGPLENHHIARFRDGHWEAIGEGFDNRVTALTVFEGKLIASGVFTRSGHTPISHLAQWDGSTWTEFGGGTRSWSQDLRVDNGALYAGGGANSLDLAPGAVPISIWRDGAWEEFGRGMQGPVRDLLVENDLLYAAGSFTQAGLAAAERVAVWDGSVWRSVGGGLGARVNTLVSHAGKIVAGGNFPASDELGPDNSSGRVGQLVGSTFLPLGEGFDDEVLALASIGGELYAGGAFEYSGESRVSHVARWDGMTWRALGRGLDGPVHALVEFDHGVVAGGEFRWSGANRTSNVAYWDGADWHQLGSGVDDRVECLAVHGGRLYAGGLFGGGGLQGVAVFDGSEWRQVGAGIDGFVFSLTSTPTHLLATGWFRSADGVESAALAAWDGSVWQYLSDGSDGWVEDAVEYRGQWYLAGRFSRMGGTPSSNIARHDVALSFGTASSGVTASAMALAPATPNPANPGTAVRLQLEHARVIRIGLYDLRGRLVRSWPLWRATAGEHDIKWDGLDNSDSPVASGVYLLRVDGGDLTAVRKLVVVR